MDHLEEDLSAYLSNELDESQKKSVEAHLSSCQTCMEKLQQLRRLESLTEQEVSIDPHPDFLKKVLGRVDQESQILRFRSRRNVAIFIVAAAVLAFFVFILSLKNPAPVKPAMVHEVPKPAISSPPKPMKEKSDDVELIAHLDELENMEVIRQFNDLDQFDAAMMLGENEVTK